ncbi:hypothetical protein [Bacillus sp. NPDC094106]|uniref:hypothetical protein n=1 Tax=Bacillus sp. NPDC094106 TaxID=3363949 RepID=UPI0037F4260D
MHTDETCPICNGKGTLTNQQLPCFVCQESGYIKDKDIMTQLINAMLVSMKYKVGFAILSTKANLNNGKYSLEHELFKNITLRSSVYPRKILLKAQDYFQMGIIEKETPKSCSDSTKFKYPSDALLDKILSYLETPEAKEIVYKWFRHERVIFEDIEEGSAKC